jgi:FixJ family two-component response regulator
MSTGVVYVVDDDASVREALELLLSLAGHAVETFASGEAFLSVELDTCGCVVLDMRLGGMDGQQVLDALSARGNELPVLMLTAWGDVPSVVRAMRSGARDFVIKSVEPAKLLTAIEALLAESAADQAAVAERRRVRDALLALTGREREVLAQAANGLDTHGTAERLGISHRTVEVHRSNIARKLGVATLSELFRLAARLGVALDWR